MRLAHRISRTAAHGHAAATVQVAEVSPAELVSLETEIASPGKVSRVSIHLVDENDIDRGAIQEVPLGGQETH